MKIGTLKSSPESSSVVWKDGKRQIRALLKKDQVEAAVEAEAPVVADPPLLILQKRHRHLGRLQFEVHRLEYHLRGVFPGL